MTEQQNQLTDEQWAEVKLAAAQRFAARNISPATADYVFSRYLAKLAAEDTDADADTVTFADRPSPSEMYKAPEATPKARAATPPPARIPKPGPVTLPRNSVPAIPASVRNRKPKDRDLKPAPLKLDGIPAKDEKSASTAAAISKAQKLASALKPVLASK